MTEAITLVVAALLAIINLSLVIKLITNNKKIKGLVERLSNLDDAANESYVKFITDSRTWAYEYIEDVQDKLAKFADLVEPQLNYFNKYGKVSNGPHDIALTIISGAYEELKTTMPENNKENK